MTNYNIFIKACRIVGTLSIVVAFAAAVRGDPIGFANFGCGVVLWFLANKLEKLDKENENGR